jgi:FMN phosphatase YigB (HAD superfamily)
MDFIFDLDHTVVDSSHRQLTKADGSLDLDAWRENCTREQIRRDTLLPLAGTMREAYENGHNVIVCTARVMTHHDKEFLRDNGLKYTALLSRAEGDSSGDADLKEGLLNWYFKGNRAKMANSVFFDDNQSVLEMGRRLGINCLDAAHTNTLMLLGQL